MFDEIKFSKRFQSINGRVFVVFDKEASKQHNAYRTTGVAVVKDDGKVYLGFATYKPKDVNPFTKKFGKDKARGLAFQKIAHESLKDLNDADFKSLVANEKELADTVIDLLKLKTKQRREECQRKREIRILVM